MTRKGGPQQEDFTVLGGRRPSGVEEKVRAVLAHVRGESYHTSVLAQATRHHHRATIRVDIPHVGLGDRFRIVSMHFSTVEGVEPAFTAVFEPPEEYERWRAIEAAAFDLVAPGYDEFTNEHFEALRKALAP